MNRNYIARGVLIAAFTLASLPAQEANKQVVQEKLAAIKQSLAQNQASLRTYSWTETTQVSLKGEVKKVLQNSCRYGPDGKIAKTPIGGEGGESEKHRRGLRGKIVEKKVDELKDYMDRVGSLISRYLPPNPQDMQAAFKAGKATLEKSSGELMFNNYVKPGDQFTFHFDPATKKLRALDVSTYLDDQQDTVTVAAQFSSLPDGTNYLEQSTLTATAKNIQIKKTNFEYQKIGQ